MIGEIMARYSQEEKGRYFIKKQIVGKDESVFFVDQKFPKGKPGFKYLVWGGNKRTYHPHTFPAAYWRKLGQEAKGRVSPGLSDKRAGRW